ncbi:hypothetical protein [Methylomonas fluvii]|nr:hypothetical protein [Methylomonas fluvii]
MGGIKEIPKNVSKILALSLQRKREAGKFKKLDCLLWE